MFVIIWEYQVSAAHTSEFEKIYSPDGAWARLFQRGTGFLGTQLLRDQSDLHRYITIDRWTSLRDYEVFRSRWSTEYEALDAQCEALTEQENLLGQWEVVLRETR